MKITTMVTASLVRLRNQLGTDDRIKVSPIYFNTMPSAGNIIVLKLRTEITSSEETEGEFKIAKRIFYDKVMKPNRHEDPWDFKLVLEPVKDDCPYDKIYLDCKVAFSSSYTGEKDWKDLHTVSIIIGPDKIPYTFVFMPNSNADYISVNNSYCRYENTIYDTVLGETQILVRPGYSENNALS